MRVQSSEESDTLGKLSERARTEPARSCESVRYGSSACNSDKLLLSVGLLLPKRNILLGVFATTCFLVALARVVCLFANKQATYALYSLRRAGASKPSFCHGVALDAHTSCDLPPAHLDHCRVVVARNRHPAETVAHAIASVAKPALAVQRSTARVNACLLRDLVLFHCDRRWPDADRLRELGKHCARGICRELVSPVCWQTRGWRVAPGRVGAT